MVFLFDVIGYDKKNFINTVTLVKFHRFLIQIITLVSLLFGTSAFAVEVTNLYTGKILVNDKTQKTRVKAHRWAIEQVLSKVSGDKDILDNDVIKREVQHRSANYIKSFAFKTDEQGRTFLVDQFYQTKIDKLIKSVGGSIWGRRRPNTLIWLVVEEGVNRSIVELEQYPQLSEILSQSSDDRGLPVLLPLMDTIDKDAIYSSDVWARFEGTVSGASERYNADNYIMARMRFVDSNKEPEYQTGWLLQFQLMKNTKQLLSDEFSGEQFAVIRSMINRVGDYFASEYAIDSEQVGADNLELILENVPNIVALTKAEKYLSSLPPVTDVQLMKVSKQQAQFYLNLSGEGLDVVRALALLPEFEKITDVEQKQPLKSLTIEQQLEILTREYLAQTQQAQQLNNSEGAKNAVVEDVKKKSITLKYKWLGK
ncbi:DUF2066 domain-containing protein [Psychrosphaera sp. F3M07]|uniref:DUF2066 domain-containing protein n=1 Tax=Psychrosphaera sp. F3M07 TaxID=2841560 RepID=UPI001C08D340|nr:DUF2066 domain-containing protein [Psychrosphaera sp. F3M07]MBU2916527.1 DUF2066 domain-containing protein [Psychrosphaera sp. F3M07]